MVAGGEVLDGDGPGRPCAEVGKKAVLLEDGQGGPVGGVADDEDAGSDGKALRRSCFVFFLGGGFGGSGRGGKANGGCVMVAVGGYGHGCYCCFGC